MECPPPQGVPCGMDFAPKWVRASARNAAFGGAGAEARVQTNAMLAPSRRREIPAPGALRIFSATGGAKWRFLPGTGERPQSTQVGRTRPLCGGWRSFGGNRALPLTRYPLTLLARIRQLGVPVVASADGNYSLVLFRNFQRPLRDTNRRGLL